MLLPVIHPVSHKIALTSIKTAYQAGVDGIFLINQGMDITELLELIPEVNALYPDLWIGVNFLGKTPEETLHLIASTSVKGIWSDNAEIHEDKDVQPAAEAFLETRKQLGWEGLYFGGVAFKYQREVPEDKLHIAAQKAGPLLDVITSSGPGTGSAAPVDKAYRLCQGARGTPLALASGISPENVEGFLPFVDAFLVASEIETSKYSGVLVPERTRLLANKIHNWRPI